ncbi:unnamed protein product [Diatraea saccharalis]|uniref:Regulatory protein zeste n=1 Tax=Diatraea saccharalis TaxID=40085 RepID=A0A9N9QU33_9NEOP|nr:unnamed protein product [Diatraea saccharalis]
MTGSKSSRHVAYEQVKAMIDFMGQNIEFATGSLRNLEARQTSKRLWGELTKILNDCRGGTKKSADGWSKYWSDFKNKLKNKAKLIKRQKRGAPLKKTVRPLTKLEKRSLVILGPYFEKKLFNSETYQNPLSDVIPPEVKLETYQESNDFSNSQVDAHDRLSGVEGDSTESAESSEGDCQDDNDFNSNDPLIHNLYPKWLIEVEKRRAEAELLRAKAEDKRASASVKSAEAALLQAEAMRKLAEAAVSQSAAIARIAAIIESRSQVQDLGSVSSTVSLPGLSI